MTLDVLDPGSIYHIYNHAVGKENLFLSADNYSYFLKRYEFFINPVADTYVYCLMPNHLHFLVEVKQNISLPSGNKSQVTQYVSKQFSNLFSSYAQAFNKQQNRRGISRDKAIKWFGNLDEFEKAHRNFETEFSPEQLPGSCSKFPKHSSPKIHS